jgi:acyl-CoA thioesterase FadM
MSGDERTHWSTRVPFSAEGPSGTPMPHTYLEWMQEAAANASTLGGYPPDRYKVLGATWIVKEVLLAVDAPVHYGDPITIETWVSDLRRFRSRREYRMKSGERTIARGQADWVLLEIDASTGRVRPRYVDEEMMTAFPRVSETALAAGEVPEIGEMPPAPSLLAKDTRRVRPTELDRHGHVNHTVYLAWLEDHARVALPDALDLTAVRIEYQLDTKLGDEVEVLGWRDGELFRQAVTRAGKTLCRAIARRPSAG